MTKYQAIAQFEIDDEAFEDVEDITNGVLEWATSVAIYPVLTDGTSDSHYEEESRPVTVGDLQKWLAGVDPNTQIVLEDGDWFVNLKSVIIPASDFGDEYSAVTLGAGEPIDSRQF